MPTPPPILKGLSEDDQREFLSAGEPRPLQPKDVLAEQGEPADFFALVEVGYLELGQVSPAGVERLVRFVGPGDCYGAMALTAAQELASERVPHRVARALLRVAEYGASAPQGPHSPSADPAGAGRPDRRHALHRQPPHVSVGG